MAPRFTQNMFNCWQREDRAEALVCFKCPPDNWTALEAQHIEFLRMLVKRLSEGKPWRNDALDQVPAEGIGDDREGLIIECPLSAESRRAQSADLCIYSSAEFSYAIDICARGIPQDRLEAHIVEAAREMNIEMPRNPLLVDRRWVMMSNLEFSLQGVKGWAVQIALTVLGDLILYGVPALLVALLLVYLWPPTKPVAFGIVILGLSALLVRDAVRLARTGRFLKGILASSYEPKNQPGKGSGAA